MRDWNKRYQTGETPWDTGEPDRHLVATVSSHGIKPGRALEIGCGTGTNALWLAEQGFDVLGVDVSPDAIAAARAKAAAVDAPEGSLAGRVGRCTFAVLDILADELPAASFDMVFDRGCFHIFDDHADRVRFAERVAGQLVGDGRWLSLIGSTEGPARDHGPPRRSVSEICAAIEPHVEIIELRAVTFDAELPSPARAWCCLAARRTVAAQPSTRRDS